VARLCGCGCGTELVRREGEARPRFARRRFASKECADRSRRLDLQPRLCACGCGELLVRRQYEAKARFEKRRFATPACWYTTAVKVSEMPPRTCECGCGLQIERNKKDSIKTFEARRFATKACVSRARKREMPTRTCKVCGTSYGRSRKPDGRLEAASNFSRRLYCSKSCATKGQTATRAVTRGTKPPAERFKTRSKPVQPKPRPKTPETPPRRSGDATAHTRPLPDPTKQPSFTVSAPVREEGTAYCPQHPTYKLGVYGCQACVAGQRWAEGQPRARPGSGPSAIWSGP
jgi:hypothetical protein